MPAFTVCPLCGKVFQVSGAAPGFPFACVIFRRFTFLEYLVSYAAI
jgi:hypothetical protein